MLKFIFFVGDFSCIAKRLLNTDKIRQSLAAAMAFVFDTLPSPKLVDVISTAETITAARFAIMSARPITHDILAFQLANEMLTLLGARQRTPLRLLVGAAQTLAKPVFAGWIGTNERLVNLLIEQQWDIWFDRSSIDTILAEHVWEHLTPEQGSLAASICFKFLKPGGRLRLAVPDGFHPDPAYRKAVEIDNKDGHKVLYNFQTMCDMLAAVGFQPALLEGFSETGTFQEQAWQLSDGWIGRSRYNDPRNGRGTVMAYTSLIVDGVKP